MGGKWIAILVLAVLIACQPALQAVPSDGAVQEDQELKPTDTHEQNPCLGIKCGKNEICKEGECVCANKDCRGECIAKNECCSNDDCSNGTCENKLCIELSCDYKQQPAEGECQCQEGYTFCREQNKCIKQGACCRHTDCPRGDRCVETSLKVSFCTETPEKKRCRLFADNERSELIETETADLRVNAEKWLSDGSVQFKINEESIILKENQTQEFEGVKIYQEGIQMIGGFCKEDNED